MNPVRVATVFTHRRPDETAAAIHTLLVLGRQHGIVLRFDSEETRNISSSRGRALSSTRR